MKLLPELSEGVLTKNLGVRVLVAVNKVDAAESLRRNYQYKDETFEFIHHYLRRTCLEYGAGLIYTSVNRSININVLSDYVQQQLYDFKEFKHRYQTAVKDSIFVPIGWDSAKKINAEFDGHKFLDEQFEQVIPVPRMEQEQHDEEQVQCNVDEEFLNKHKDLLESAVDSASASDIMSRLGSPLLRGEATPTRDKVKAAASTPSKPKTPKRTADSAAARPEDVASFFTNLLKPKKQTRSRSESTTPKPETPSTPMAATPNAEQ